jgi:hypothetical protein
LLINYLLACILWYPAEKKRRKRERKGEIERERNVRNPFGVAESGNVEIQGTDKFKLNNIIVLQVCFLYK